MSLARRASESDEPIFGEGIDVEQLPSPPGVAMRILALANDPNAGADDLAAVIKNDAALTARMLKVVNSPMYGMSGKVDTIERAVMILGFRQVRLMSLAFSVADALPDIPESVGFDLGTYWLRSLVAATSAREVAQRIDAGLADTAFIAGLLQPLGRLALACVQGERYRPVLEEDPWPGSDLERSHLGFSSAELTATLLDRWSLPRPLVIAALFSEDPAALPTGVPDDTARLARIIAFAVQIGAAATVGMSFDQLVAGGQATVGFSESQVEDVVRSVMSQLSGSADLVTGKLPPGVSADQLMSEGRSTISSMFSKRSGLAKLAAH